MLFLGLFIAAFWVTALGLWDWRSLVAVEGEAGASLRATAAQAIVPIDNFLYDIMALLQAETDRPSSGEGEIVHLRFITSSNPQIESLVVQGLNEAQTRSWGRGSRSPRTCSAPPWTSGPRRVLRF